MNIPKSVPLPSKSRFVPTRRASDAFTLIELLVVIAIIAILAAILFPVFAQAREKARATACLSNTKQLANAIAMYTQDYDETLPVQYNLYNPPALEWWDELLQTYLKNFGVFACPDKPDYNIAGYTPGAAYGTGGYGYNFNLGGSFGSAGYDYPAKMISQIASPAGTFCICDGAQMSGTSTTTGIYATDNLQPQNWLKYETGPTSYQIYPPSGWNPTDLKAKSTTVFYTTSPTNTNYARRPSPRHNGGLNIVFCDGHAKWETITGFLGVTPARPAGYPYGDPSNSWDDQ